MASTMQGRRPSCDALHAKHLQGVGRARGRHGRDFAFNWIHPSCGTRQQNLRQDTGPHLKTPSTTVSVTVMKAWRLVSMNHCGLGVW